MKTAYTDSFNIDESGVLIGKHATPGNGKIPTDVAISAVLVIPVLSASQIAIKGLHASSNWASYTAGEGHLIEGVGGAEWDMFYVKSASGTIAVNLIVKG